MGMAYPQPAEKIVLNTDKQWYYPGESIWVAVNTFDACGDTLAELSAVAYVELLSPGGTAAKQVKLKVDHALGQGSLTIDGNLASGRYTVVAYTSWMKNLGATTFARKPVYIVNPVKPGMINTAYSNDSVESVNSEVTLQTDKKVYSRRDKVNVNYAVTGAQRVLLSVYKLDALEKGANKIHMSNIGNACNGVGKKQYPFEYRGQVVTGKIIDPATQQPVSGIRGYLSAPDFPKHFHTAISDSSGTITFFIGDMSGETGLVLKTASPDQKQYLIELNNPFAGTVDVLPTVTGENIFESKADVIDDAMVSAQVQQLFWEDTVQHQMPESDVLNYFYGRPDAVYHMKEYVQFNTVEEILREYVYLVNVRKRRGKVFPVVLNALTRKPYSQPPLILVNGVPIFDVDEFMSMNADDFETIAVVGRRFTFTNPEIYGVIDVRLNKKLEDYGRNSQVVDYHGTEVKHFAHLNYDSDAKRRDRRPDFRNVLYWNPSIDIRHANGSVDFFTSDLTGKFMVVMQIISPEGKISISNTTFEVQK